MTEPSPFPPAAPPTAPLSLPQARRRLGHLSALAAQGVYEYAAAGVRQFGGTLDEARLQGYLEHLSAEGSLKSAAHLPLDALERDLLQTLTFTPGAAWTPGSVQQITLGAFQTGNAPPLIYPRTTSFSGVSAWTVAHLNLPGMVGGVLQLGSGARAISLPLGRLEDQIESGGPVLITALQRLLARQPGYAELYRTLSAGYAHMPLSLNPEPNFDQAVTAAPLPLDERDLTLLHKHHDLRPATPYLLKVSYAVKPRKKSAAHPALRHQVFDAALREQPINHAHSSDQGTLHARLPDEDSRGRVQWGVISDPTWESSHLQHCLSVHLLHNLRLLYKRTQLLQVSPSWPTSGEFTVLLPFQTPGRVQA